MVVGVGKLSLGHQLKAEHETTTAVVTTATTTTAAVLSTAGVNSSDGNGSALSHSAAAPNGSAATAHKHSTAHGLRSPVGSNDFTQRLLSDEDVRSDGPVITVDAARPSVAVAVAVERASTAPATASAHLSSHPAPSSVPVSLASASSDASSAVASAATDARRRYTAAEQESFFVFSMQIFLILSFFNLFLSIALQLWSSETNGIRAEMMLLNFVVFSLGGLCNLALFGWNRYMSSPLRPFKKRMKRAIVQCLRSHNYYGSPDDKQSRYQKPASKAGDTEQAREKRRRTLFDAQPTAAVEVKS